MKSNHDQSETPASAGMRAASTAQPAVSLREIIALHVIASGPVSFASVFAHVGEQFTGRAEDCDVAEAINQLIRAGIVALYDDGETFTAGPVRWNVLNEPQPKDARALLLEIAETCERTKCSTAGDGNAMLGAIAADVRRIIAKI